MATLTAEVSPLIAAADLLIDTESTVNVTVSLSAVASSQTDVDASTQSSFAAVASLTASIDVSVGAASYSAGTIQFVGTGSVDVVVRTVPVYAAPTGTVDNIGDLPSNPPAGAVYEVLGTSAGAVPVTAIWDDIESEWIFQPILSGRSTRSITYVNTTIGTYVTMPDYINVNGFPHTPLYWSKSVLGGSFAYSLVDIPDPVVQAVPPPSQSGPTVWKWKVEDLADPGKNPYSLNSWPEHSGSGPTWYSTSFYRPRVKSTVKFNNKKNKTRKQRSVTFIPGPVDHMWMNYSAGLSQPFTVIVVGIIHSYPTAKFGHYILDTAKETPIYDANKTGKDFFFHEGATPRNVMLFQKKSALMAVNDHPYSDLKNSKYIRIKHTERARPRMFYGVFNGSNSLFGARDQKVKYHGSGDLLNLGAHKYFGIGRRVDRVSDNRASHMSIWEIQIYHAALTKKQIYDIYEEVSNYYKFKAYR